MLNLCLELMRRLKAEGHEVAYAGPEAVRTVVEEAGVPFHSLSTHPPTSGPDPSPRQSPLGKPFRWLQRVVQRRQLREAAADALVDPGYARLVATVDPDVLLVDIELPGYAIVGYAHAPRVGLLNQFVSSRKQRRLPPLHTSVIPGRGIRGTFLGVEWTWLRYRVWKATRHFMERLRAPGSDPISGLRALADRHGFPHRREFALYDWLYPFSFRHLPTLNLNPLSFDFPHEVHPSDLYTGALLPPRHINGAGTEDESFLVVDRLLGQRRPDRGLIYCGFGAAFAGNDSDFLERLIQALRPLDQWDVIIGLGGRTIDLTHVEIPSHVHVFDWVPQLEVLPAADCAVLHAGAVSIYECIQVGVPMVLFPFEVNDQLGLAARALALGVAHVGDRANDDPTQIRTAIERVLSDPKIIRAQERARSDLRSDLDNRVGVRAVERLLAQSAR